MNIKKLSLNRETLMPLHDAEAEQAIAGVIVATRVSICHCLLTPTCACTLTPSCRC